jgi:hypothetical protein
MRSLGIIGLLLLLGGSLITGCHVEKSEDERDESKAPVVPISGGQPVTTTTTTTTTTSFGTKRTLTVCESYESYNSSQLTCYQENNRMWLSDCELGQCSELQVNVHYMLPDDLGLGRTVIVEAFDNHLFQGSPASVLRMTNFDASRPGTHANDSLLISSGEYYVRAYFANDNGPAAPYQYGGMEIVSDQPFGLYGALSDATRIVVGVSPAPMVNIYLDKLFKTPGMEDPTNAHARVVVTIDPGYSVPLGQKVIIQLHANEDFDFHPAYEFKLASESLKVAGAEGHAEYVSDQLDVEDYFVFAWLDVSGNGFFDPGEPNQTYQVFGEVGRIHVEKDKTVSIELHLE